MRMEKSKEWYFKRLTIIEQELGVLIRMKIFKKKTLILNSLDQLIDELSYLTKDALASNTLDGFDKADFQRGVMHLLELFKECREMINAMFELQMKVQPAIRCKILTELN
ncbi:hypothetical protein [Pantoea sp. JKS000250]|uniref:hypothetical protein n=1 Tax=Pantoea sp. JKS000250 TaxID=1938795 RepID=UPI000D88D7CE|nr:hypothetical protein [Pantoea sp. JKS000250]PXW21003.1 hypothetical protein BY447_2681 [Pantoea sp. JKS000250]